MLELNINTYVSIDEANSYISSHYLSSDELRLKWEETSEEDKEILLINACENIERLKFIGCKYNKNQELSFPRNYSDIIPFVVKKAQIEEAISFFKKTDALDAYKEGLKAESIDDVSKTYNIELLSNRKLRSTKAEELLRGWLYGSFKIS